MDASFLQQFHTQLSLSDNGEMIRALDTLHPTNIHEKMYWRQLALQQHQQFLNQMDQQLDMLNQLATNTHQLCAILRSAYHLSKQ
jgi:hypothetical protein